MVSTVFLGGMVVYRKEVNYSEIIKRGIKRERLNLVLEKLHKKVKDELLMGLYDERIKELRFKETRRAKGTGPLMDFLTEVMLPDLKRVFRVELSEPDIRRIASSLPSVEDTREGFLALFKTVYNLLQERVDRERYKSLVKKWLAGIPRPMTSVEGFEDLLRRVIKEDLSKAIGGSLAEALLHKVLSEIHPLFLKQPNAFEVIIERILNSGVVVKMTDPDWRQMQRERWLDRYRNIVDSRPLNV